MALQLEREPGNVCIEVHEILKTGRRYYNYTKGQLCQHENYSLDPSPWLLVIILYWHVAVEFSDWKDI